MTDWSVVIGLALGLGLPGMSGLFIIVRMENRLTQLESDREVYQRWRETVTLSLAGISKDVNQLIGMTKTDHHS